MHYTRFTFAVLWGTGGGGRYTAVMEQNQYGFSIGVNQHGFKILMKDIPENKLTQKILATVNIFSVNFSSWHISHVKTTMDV